MAKIVILSQEIFVQSIEDLQDDAILQPIKAQFVKKCVLESLHKFTKLIDIPQELLGFILHFEAAVKNSDILRYTDDELSLWLDHQINCMQQRERTYFYWNRNAQANKLSCILNRLKQRIFSSVYEESNEIEAIMVEAKKDLKNQIEKEIVLQIFLKAIRNYQSSCIWPINEERAQQQQELFLLIKQAPDAQVALNILNQSIMHIEQSHLLTSFAANLPCYQRKSRLAAHLLKASQEISIKIKATKNKSLVEQNVELAVKYYLSDDVFYHNRKRQVLAQQLLMQLRADSLLFSDGKEIQKKYKMRSTLDQFIKKLDDDFKSTHFFSQFYTTRRSRLAINLDVVKEALIKNQCLSALELENDIKGPITQVLKLIFNENISTDMGRDMNSLLHAVMEAQTPHAIEAILEGHIRSYLKQASDSDLLTCFKNFLSGHDNSYFRIAIKLESALLEWQSLGILPAASGYKTFLNTLATDRQNNENDLQRLESQYGIKIPRATCVMKTQANTIAQQAHSLLKRIQAL